MSFAWYCRDVEDREFLISELDMEPLVSAPNTVPDPDVSVLKILHLLVKNDSKCNVVFIGDLFEYFHFLTCSSFLAWRMFWNRAWSIR